MSIEKNVHKKYLYFKHTHRHIYCILLFYTISEPELQFWNWQISEYRNTTSYSVFVRVILPLKQTYFKNVCVEGIWTGCTAPSAYLTGQVVYSDSLWLPRIVVSTFTQQGDQKSFCQCLTSVQMYVCSQHCWCLQVIARHLSGNQAASHIYKIIIGLSISRQTPLWSKWQKHRPVWSTLKLAR